MDAHNEMLVDQFEERIPVFEKIREFALERIEKGLKEQNITVAGVEGRVKKLDSFKGKMELKGYKYDSIYDITDCVGCRVITFYAHEVDKVAGIIGGLFNVDWSDSVDKRNIQDSDRFGYLSLHYIVSIPESTMTIEGCPDFNKIRFEIQMRTILQHMWSTANHDTGYKSDIQIPKRYSRKLAQLAGLMEIADNQFDELISDIENYRRNVKEMISNGDLESVDLDWDAFQNYLQHEPFVELNKRIASINMAEIRETTPYPYFEVLKKLGIEKMSELQEMREKYSDDAYRLAVAQLSGTDLDILSSNVGLQNVILSYLIREKGLKGLIDYYDITQGGKNSVSQAERIMKLAKKANIIPAE